MDRSDGANPIPADTAYARKQVLFYIDHGAPFIVGDDLKTDAEIKADTVAALAERRWRAEEAGIIFQGHAYSTTRESRSLISQTMQRVTLDPTTSRTWKTADVDEHGVPVTVLLSAGDIRRLSDAVEAYVERCFAVEVAKNAELAPLTDKDEILAWREANLDAGWPGVERVE